MRLRSKKHRRKEAATKIRKLRKDTESLKVESKPTAFGRVEPLSQVKRGRRRAVQDKAKNIKISLGLGKRETLQTPRDRRLG